MAAPGTQITTLGWSVSKQCSITLNSSGTSFSAPHVTGTATLLMDRDLVLKSWP